MYVFQVLLAGNAVLDPAAVPAGILFVDILLGISPYFTVRGLKLRVGQAEHHGKRLFLSENAAYQLLSDPVRDSPAVMVAVGKGYLLNGSIGLG